MTRSEDRTAKDPANPSSGSRSSSKGQPAPDALNPPNSQIHRGLQASEKGGIRRAELSFVATAIVPALLFYLAFRFYPIAQAFYLSLTDSTLLTERHNFIGLRNYSLLFHDPVFQRVVANTAVFSITTTFATTIVAIILAILLNPVSRGSALFRLLYFLPSVTSTIAIAVVWLWIYQPRFGLLNQILASAHLPTIGWLISPQWAMPSLVIMNIWKDVGFFMLIIFAGLRNIPPEYTEAAIMDGATSLRLARYVTLPLLSRVIVFVLVTGIIESFHVFQQVYVMTRGGPLDATRVLALHIYDYAFARLWIGQASSMAFILFGLVLGFTLILLRMQRHDWEL